VPPAGITTASGDPVVRIELVIERIEKGDVKNLLAEMKAAIPDIEVPPLRVELAGENAVAARFARTAPKFFEKPHHSS
jgi:hypothetical protein